MLPFLDKDKIVSVVSARMKPTIEDHDNVSVDKALELISNDLIEAVHSKDTQGVVDALRSAFMVLESEPHVEGEHIEGDE